MTFPTVVVKDGNGTLQTVNTLPNAGQDTMANSLPVVLASNQSAIPVSGTVAVSSVAGNVAITAAALPLPSGASTSAKQPALGTAGAASADVLTVQGVASMTALKVDGSAVTQPVSAASLPLPSGASTAAKQPALGTAGAASADVITVQGVTSMTALKVDGSAVTQPVSAASLPLPTGASTSALQPTNAAIASTTSGQTGHLVMGAVTTAAPTYTTAQTNPLSLDTAGNLRIVQSASEAFLGHFGGIIINPSANFTRPATTPTFASGQLVANSATAGSVVPLSWATAARTSAGNFYLRRLRLRKSSTTLTNASFRVHFYTSSPTFTNGETAAWLTTQSGYLGAIDVTMTQAFSDGAEGVGAPNAGSEINVALASGQTIYACVEARGAYVGVASEVFTAEPEIWQN